MATVTTQAFTHPVIEPYDTSNIRAIDSTNVPWGAMSHVTEFDAPAIGTGDVGLLKMYFYMPDNYLAVLNGFHIDQSCTSEPKWESGFFRTKYFKGNSFVPGQTAQQVNFPCAVTSEARVGSTGYKNVSIASAGANSAYDVNSPINFNFGRGEIVEVHLYNTTEGVHATTFKVALNWKLYDANQGNFPFLGSV
jgi:hypothetical protein